MTFLYRDIPLHHQRVNGHILHIYLVFFSLTKRRTIYNLYRIFCSIFLGLNNHRPMAVTPQGDPRLSGLYLSANLKPIR